MSFIIFINKDFRMKVSLPNKSPNCRANGLEFDLHGVCEVDKKTIQSLLDVDKLFEVEEVKAPKKPKK